MCWRSGPRIDDGIPPLAGATIGSGLNGWSHDGIEHVGFVQRCPRKRQSLVRTAERPSALSVARSSTRAVTYGGIAAFFI